MSPVVKNQIEIPNFLYFLILTILSHNYKFWFFINLFISNELVFTSKDRYIMLILQKKLFFITNTRAIF